ncbi:MAG: transposase [Acidobacteria bacterium]|nr:transposase [Acidobacteriota bacterium]
MPLVTYLITFSCYGHRLHGHPDGSVDRHHRTPGTPHLQPDSRWLAQATRTMKHPAYTLDAAHRAVVLDALRQCCLRNDWELHAAHVRPTHVHVVVVAPPGPEKLLHALKSAASQRLNALEPESADRKRWARHGSTRWLWEPHHVRAAIKYVVEEQGPALAVYQAE